MAALPRLVGAALALVLGTDAFLVYGALVAHAVTPEDAVARYRRAPGPPVVAGPPPGVYTDDTRGYVRRTPSESTCAYPVVS